ncbi:MAG: DUF1553 domain-containing protein [Pirellulaceae bacterium]|nr:DUF1553 domain-containing protein [Pirellulaceae bacterium]
MLASRLYNPLLHTSLLRWQLSVLAVIATCALSPDARCFATEPVNFDRDIRPILSEHCYTCHGPDAGKLKAGLRLDQKESAFGRLESGSTAVVAGKPSDSELIRRIHSPDADEVMPPPDGGKPLTAAQISALENWIASGASWANHWSFERIQSPAVPAVTSGRVNNAIDNYIVTALQSHGLTQSPSETKERLIRRVTLDLTGLPPTVKEVDDFLADESPLAFERVVDRLLGSQHFGERLALPWLDLARYGDTSGYHNDSLRDMWLWREWVIGAFNRNLPFNQFTIEQLAGDLLPSATIDQKVASGFHRNVMTSDEGGLIDAEYRNLYVVDRIATTGVTWLGMTIACAQCHDHKYDPMTQRDYYAFYAFFNNVPENGKDGVRDRNPMPFLSVPTEAQQVQLQQYTEQLAAAESQLAELTKSLAEKQTAWEQSLVSAGLSDTAANTPIADATFPLDENGTGKRGDGTEIAAKSDGNVQFDEGLVGKSFKPAKSAWFEYGETFNFEKDQPFSVSTYLMVTPAGGAPFGKMNDADGARGWDVEFHGLRPSVHLIHRFPQDAIHIQADEDLPANVFTHLAFTYDGSGKAAGLKLYVNGVLAKSSIKIDSLKGSILSGTPFSIGRRSGLGTPFEGRIDDLRVYNRELTLIEVGALTAAETLKVVNTPVEQRAAKQKEQLEKLFRQTQVPEFAAMQKSVADLRKTKDDFAAKIPNTMVMSEMEKPRDTFIKVRGNYDQDGEKVTAAVPSFLPQVPPLADGKQLNRLHLAEWLVSPDHPLTARVTMNRWWAMLFGTGIVKTLNDFGSQGERPTHPELLDWLAADLMRDWDTKRVIKQIVMSATYQQSSQVTRELLTVDQENRWLARVPRQRLDAEAIRDNALAIAGILNPAIGGKSIKPAQPAGTWEINEMGGYPYDKSTGNDLYRRGLYVYWRRSTVYPSFVTLDAPTREFCVAQRAKTSTPLQSLVLMNDPVFVESARAFAQRLLAEPNLDNTARTRLAWRIALARNPSESEHAILNRTLEQQLTTYRNDKEAAKKLISVGDLAKPDSLDDSELAAWTALSNVILNLNETISN